MSRTFWKRNSTIFGVGIVVQGVYAFEIDGRAIIKYSIDCLGCNNLFALKCLGISVAQQNFGLGTTHNSCLELSVQYL